MLYTGAFQAATGVVAKLVPAVGDNFKYLAPVGVVLEAMNLYNINKAEGTTPSTSSSTTIAYVTSAIGLLGSGNASYYNMTKADTTVSMADEDADVDQDDAA